MSWITPAINYFTRVSTKTQLVSERVVNVPRLIYCDESLCFYDWRPMDTTSDDGENALKPLNEADKDLGRYIKVLPGEIVYQAVVQPLSEETPTAFSTTTLPDSLINDYATFSNISVSIYRDDDAMFFFSCSAMQNVPTTLNTPIKTSSLGTWTVTPTITVQLGTIFVNVAKQAGTTDYTICVRQSIKVLPWP